jgi:nucleoside 2-deoxyribosyltransferase
MLKVYTASKLHKAETWMQLCADNDHVFFHARWLKHIRIGTPDTEKNAKEFWLQDEQDVRDADVVLVWGDEGHHLRGALVEAGIAIATGVPVIVIGDHPDYGTWQYHPGVTRAPNINVALDYLRSIKPRYHSR